MRPIDADAFLAKMKRTNRYFDVKFDVEEMPTLDPAQLVPQGEWVMKHPNGYACSKCGEWGLMLDNRGIYPSNFCPNCGARMRKENE